MAHTRKSNSPSCRADHNWDFHFGRWRLFFIAAKNSGIKSGRMPFYCGISDHGIDQRPWHQSAHLAIAILVKSRFRDNCSKSLPACLPIVRQPRVKKERVTVLYVSQKPLFVYSGPGLIAFAKVSQCILRPS